MLDFSALACVASAALAAAALLLTVVIVGRADVVRGGGGCMTGVVFLARTLPLPPSCVVGPKNTRAAPDLRSHVDTVVVLILGGPGMRAC